MIEQFEEIKDRLQSSVSGAFVDLQVFDSGNIILDVKLKDKLVVMAYFSNDKTIGVSEVKEGNEGFDMSFEYVTKNIKEAADYFFRQLEA